MKMTKKVLFGVAGAIMSAGVFANEGTAKIIIMKEGFYNGSHGTAVTVNDRYLGHLKPNYFVETTVTPGEMTILSRSENTPELTLNVEAGKTYYVVKESKSGVHYVRTELSLIDKALAEKAMENNEAL